MLAYPLNAPSTPLLSVFTFTAGSLPFRPLSFSKTTKPKCPRSRKRTRPLSDLDDQDSGSKKKRRLRLLLITSRLSRPFSTPATHIVDRGSSKIAVWAKKKQLVPQALRKAAIMNHIRRRHAEKEAWLRKDSGISVGEDERAETRRAVMEEMKLESPNAINIGYPAPGKYLVENTIAPSPLGLSNYDALDDEDDYGYYDEESEDGGSVSGSARVKKTEKSEREPDGEYYSDWNCFDSTEDAKNEDDEDEYDDPFSLSVLSSELAKEKRPPSPPDGKIIELLKEQEREREVLFLGFHEFG